MSNNKPNISVKIIKVPLQKDENGNPIANIDPKIILESIAEIEKTEQPPKDQNSPELSNATPTPNQIFERAKKYILYQDDALKSLSTVFYYHLESRRRYRSVLQSNNKPENGLTFLLSSFNESQLTNDDAKFISQAPIFLTGKTGSGKTHMIKQLCKMFDINFTIVNSTSISNAGYKGMTLADIGANLLDSANREKAKAEFSVVFFDEFDKLFLDSGEANLGIYHRSLVSEILTIIEGTTNFPVRDESGFDSSKILFILGGSFNMHQAEEKAVIGFTGEKQLQQNPDTQLKLTSFGLPDELAGRIGKIIAMQNIDEDLMIHILLESPSSPFVAFREKLVMVDCTVEIHQEALEDLLKKQSDAIKKFGVRGLYQGFNEMRQIVDIMFDAPDYPKTHYIITKTGFTTQRDKANITESNIEKQKKLEEANVNKPLATIDYQIPF